MLRLKTSDGTRDVFYSNFNSSLTENPKKYAWSYRDPFTGKEMNIVSRLPQITTLEAQEAVSLLQELNWHRQCCLRKGKPSPSLPQMGCLWLERCMQTDALIASVKRRLDGLVWEIFHENFPDEEADMYAEYPSLGLFTPEEHVQYWYANDCFAHDIDEETIPQVRLYLECQMLDWLDALDELSDRQNDAESTPFYQLQKFRCDEKQMQIDQLDSMRQSAKRSDESNCTKQLPKNFYDYLPMGIDMEQAPQWLGISELIEEIEKLNLCMEDSISPPDELIAKLRQMHEELLDELNRRMVSLICKHSGYPPVERQACEQIAPQGNIRFPFCFLEGRTLERPEDFIACWYLNNAFPYRMEPEQLQRVEAELTHQMDILEDQYDAYSNDGEANFWRLRYSLKVQQLEQIQEEVSAADF